MTSLLFGNGTGIVHWRDSPTTRGTFDILVSCVTTLLLCVWTAVHLNVAPPEPIWRLTLRKVGWLVLVLGAPEMVAYTAWYQRSQAKEIMHFVNHKYGLPNPLSNFHKAINWTRHAFKQFKDFSLKQKPRLSKQPTLEAQKPEEGRPWTMVHGFYAHMGGLAIRISNEIPESQKFLPSDTSKLWFLKKRAVKFVITQTSESKGLLRVSEEEIMSKSKANGLAKTLVCIQALWFIAQCLTRLIEKIPISLLELNTFGHAICALLIYLLWWEKPFEVDHPTILQDQSLWDLCAYDYMAREPLTARPIIPKITSYVKRHPRLKASKSDLPVSLSKLAYCRQDPFKMIGLVLRGLFKKIDPTRFKELDFVFDPDQRQVFPVQEVDRNPSDQVAANGECDGNNMTVLLPGQSLAGTGWKVKFPFNLEIPYKGKDFSPPLQSWIDYGDDLAQERFDHKKYNGPTIDLPYHDLQLDSRDIKRWRMAWQAYSGTLQHKFDIGLSSGYPKHLPKGWFRSQISNWPDVDDLLFSTLGLGFCAAALIYGGLHALAWSAYFESTTQRLLWRISSCVVMGGLPAVFLLMFSLDEFVSDFWIGCCSLLAMLICLLYVVARAYLVVECFINLFHLPAGVYDVPQWSAYFPHIG